jgi:hypothetical protein
MTMHKSTRYLALAFPLLVSAAALAQTGGTSTTGKDAGAATTASVASSAKPATSGSAAASATTTAVATSAPSGPSTAPAGSAVAMDGATYNVRLRDLEARVDELKDQIRRSHTRLALLSDTILSGGAAGSRSEINYHNEMSSAFRLVRALFVLDGAVQYNRQDDTGALADQKDIPIYSGSITPGDHTMSALLTFQGNGYGVFTYLRGYKFEVKSSHSFTAVEGKTLSVTATSFEGGGVTTPLQDRPKIEWKEKVQALGAGAGAANSGGNAQAAGGDKK